MLKRRSTLRSPNRARRRRIILIAKSFALCAVVALLVFGISYLSKIPALTIREINIRGNSTVSSTEIERMALEPMQGNYLGLFSRKNIFLYPRRAIKDAIHKRFSQVKNITISFKNFHTIYITIEEYKPSAVWCSEKNGKSGVIFTDNCYFMDEAGYVFGQSPQFSGNVYPRYYGLISSTSSIGSQYLSADDFRTLNAFVSKVSSLGLASRRVVAEEDDTFKMYLENGGTILFSAKVGLEKTLENLQSVLSSSSLSRKGDSPLSGLDYLDLRFGNKIFYKFLREEATSTPL